MVIERARRIGLKRIFYVVTTDGNIIVEIKTAHCLLLKPYFLELLHYLTTPWGLFTKAKYKCIRSEFN